MTGKIKLNAASGGGSVSFQAPSSTGDDRIITLPTTANGTVLTTTNPKAGNILQVVSTTKVDGFTSTNSSFVDITGFSVDITPSSTSSKILIMVSMSIGGEGTAYPAYKVLRGSTAVALGTYSTGGSQTPCSFGYQSDSDHKTTTASFQYLDSPSTTSSTTYKVQVASTHSSHEVSVNRPTSGTNQAYTHAGTSTITVMEVAA